MTKNQKIRVKSTHIHHPSRIGYFQFLAGANNDTVVLAESPTETDNDKGVYFAISLNDIETVE